tara:strand:- start:1973 stop:2263 length:291 start_codon:yes stop_codon:yes gene_type:complete
MNTDKYEGHTEGDWYIDEDSILRKIWTDEDDENRQEQLFAFDIMIIPENVSEANMWLIADAPKLLAFYLRVKEIMDMEEIEEIVRVGLILQEMDRR